jgi:thiamine pyrophosphate-dependent acetolactate synthase large subunit-like protein
VVIALPEDMLTQAASVADALPYAVTETHPGAAPLAEMQQRLAAAQRPVVILGGSRWSEAAVQQVTRFAEAYALPVYCSFRHQMLFSATQLKNPDFCEYAQVFGGHGEKVTTTAEFGPALVRARASGKPAILHCLLDPEAITPTSTLQSIRTAALAAD